MCSIFRVLTFDLVCKFFLQLTHLWLALTSNEAKTVDIRQFPTAWNDRGGKTGNE
jgi:hypothetical protein